MKMTMHIDESLLERVIAISGCSSKTEAVDYALRELERRHRLSRYAESGLGFSAAELKEGVDPAYDVLSARKVDKPVRYGKRRSRR